MRLRKSVVSKASCWRVVELIDPPENESKFPSVIVMESELHLTCCQISLASPNCVPLLSISSR